MYFFSVYMREKRTKKFVNQKGEKQIFCTEIFIIIHYDFARAMLVHNVCINALACIHSVSQFNEQHACTLNITQRDIHAQ